MIEFNRPTTKITLNSCSTNKSNFKFSLPINIFFLFHSFILGSNSWIIFFDRYDTFHDSFNPVHKRDFKNNFAIHTLGTPCRRLAVTCTGSVGRGWCGIPMGEDGSTNGNGTWVVVVVR